MPFPRSVNFLPATNAQLRSTSYSLPKFSHLQNPNGGVNHFRSQATNKGFLSGHPVSRNVDFPPATNAALRSTISSSSRISNPKTPHGWGKSFGKATNNGFLSAQSDSLEAPNLDNIPGSKAVPRSGVMPDLET